jgi:hypothetical protein
MRVSVAPTVVCFGRGRWGENWCAHFPSAVARRRRHATPLASPVTREEFQDPRICRPSENSVEIHRHARISAYHRWAPSSPSINHAPGGTSP